VLSILAATDPSKVPFFICGGALAVWAVVLSSIGLRRPDFPGSEGGVRAVILISVTIVVSAMVAAVATG
jgi:hypothetical protein